MNQPSHESGGGTPPSRAEDLVRGFQYAATFPWN